MAKQKAIKKVDNAKLPLLDSKVPVFDRYSHLATRWGNFVNASIQPDVSEFATVTAVNAGDTAFILCGSADYQEGRVVPLFCYAVVVPATAKQLSAKPDELKVRCDNEYTAYWFPKQKLFWSLPQDAEIVERMGLTSEHACSASDGGDDEASEASASSLEKKKI